MYDIIQICMNDTTGMYDDMTIYKYHPDVWYHVIQGVLMVNFDNLGYSHLEENRHTIGVNHTSFARKLSQNDTCYFCMKYSYDSIAN